LQIIALDKTNKTVMGKFSFKALKNRSKAIADISEGEFNLVYQTY